MESTILILTILILIVLSTILLCYWAITKTKSVEIEQKELNKFTTDVVFEEYPRTISIGNNKTCNLDTLVPCKMDDPTTVFGCSELLVKCQHFENDIVWKHSDGTEKIIPKNETSNDGYCLVIGEASEACNPYTGDFVLATIDPSSNEYALICNCKNPGFIDKTTLLGNCDHYYICDGKVKDKNKHIEDLECECTDKTQFSSSEFGYPKCKTYTFLEAKQQNIPIESIVDLPKRYMDINYMDPIYRDNMSSKYIINPCASPNALNSLWPDVENKNVSVLDITIITKPQLTQNGKYTCYTDKDPVAYGFISGHKYNNESTAPDLIFNGLEKEKVELIYQSNFDGFKGYVGTSKGLDIDIDTRRHNSKWLSTDADADLSYFLSDKFNNIPGPTDINDDGTKPYATFSDCETQWAWSYTCFNRISYGGDLERRPQAEVVEEGETADTAPCRLYTTDITTHPHSQFNQSRTSRWTTVVMTTHHTGITCIFDKSKPKVTEEDGTTHYYVEQSHILPMDDFNRLSTQLGPVFIDRYGFMRLSEFEQEDNYNTYRQLLT